MTIATMMTANKVVSFYQQQRQKREMNRREEKEDLTRKAGYERANITHPNTPQLLQHQQEEDSHTNNRTGALISQKTKQPSIHTHMHPETIWAFHFKKTVRSISCFFCGNQ
jgi:hypothetical protein